jgi:nucleotide-binding universal stress UspA family protein
MGEKCKKNGIRCHAIVQSWCTSTSDAVLKIANKEKVDLIAMAAQSGPVSSALLGSATRQVIRNAIKPIWILRA